LPLSPLNMLDPFNALDLLKVLNPFKVLNLPGTFRRSGREHIHVTEVTVTVLGSLFAASGSHLVHGSAKPAALQARPSVDAACV